MSTPLVTVLMAVHNGLPYLPQAIRSVLAQTFPDFELLIIDDASTDESLACIRRYTDPRIRLWVNPKNLGQARSLNEGLTHARSPYVARLDQDDVCLPERLERQMRYLEEHPEVALVGSRMVGIDEGGRRIDLFGKALSDVGMFVGWLLSGVCPIGHPTVMCRRSSIEQLGGYDERYQIGQDYDLWIRFALARFRAAVLSEPLVQYRMHSTQQSAADRLAHRRELIAIHERLVEQFCPIAHIHQVACLLRMDEAFWSACASKEDVGAAAQAVEETLDRVRQQLHLTADEFSTMKKLVARRIGFGVKLAPWLVKGPAIVAYPMVGLLSPLLIPHCRPLLSRARQSFRRCRVAMRQRVSNRHRTSSVVEWVAPRPSDVAEVGGRLSS